MNVNEFRELDKIGAYDEFFSVEELVGANELPPSLVECLPTKCTCGSDFIINYPDFGTIMCCNPKCINKMGHALHAVFVSFGCPNMGPEISKKLIQFGYDLNLMPHDSHLDVLRFTEDNFPTHVLGASWWDFKNALTIIKNSRMRFNDLVSHVGIPTFGKESRDIFQGIINLTHLVKELKHSNIIDFLAVRGVYDLKRALYLRSSLTDIMLLQTFLDGGLIVPAEEVIEIAITGAVSVNGNKMNRPEFVSYCNLVTHGKIEVRDCKAFTRVKFVVADANNGSATFIEGASRNIIISANEFVEYLKEEVSECQMKEVKI